MKNKAAKQITAHMIVKNEEQWVWYAIKSVIDYVNNLIIYDTGSRDDTVKMIKTFESNKIKLSEKGTVTSVELVKLRNLQIKETTTPWFLIVDGDEVWPRKTISELIKKIGSSDSVGAYGVKAIVPVGDLYHYQPSNAGKYNLAGHKGHYNLRAYKIDKNYLWQGVYPLEAYKNKNGISIQEQSGKISILDNEYWHLTHLKRSGFDDHHKRKLEIGYRDKLSLPEAFYIKRPHFVPSPWVKYTLFEKILAYIQTPLKYIKRSIFHD